MEGDHGTETPPLVSARRLTKVYQVKAGARRRTVTAVDDVSLDIAPNSTEGLVGESGSGKSTLGRMVLGLEPPTSGDVTIGGEVLTALSTADLRRFRRNVQPVFQDPRDSMNSRMTIRAVLSEPRRVNRLPASEGRSVEELLDLVQLPREYADRFPTELSGGQSQRVAIARALALDPYFMVLDEPTSSLDASIQAQVINLLRELQHDLGLTYLFISHDLPLVRHVARHTTVMYLGHVVESGSTSDLFRHPRHPYTQLLLASVPRADRDSRSKPPMAAGLGGVSDPGGGPPGCPFASRCPIATERCWQEAPPLREVGEAGHMVACFYAETSRVT